MNPFSDFDETCSQLLSEIDTTAYGLKILSINANIETLRAVSFLISFEDVIIGHMLCEAKLVDKLIDKYGGLSCDFTQLSQKLNDCTFCEILVTDDNGAILSANKKAQSGHRLPSSAYSQLAASHGKCYLTYSGVRQADGSCDKAVLLRRDHNAGYICISYPYVPPKGRLTIESFGVVSSEIKKLSEEIQSSLEILMSDVAEASADQLSLSKKRRIINTLSQIQSTANLTNLMSIRAKIEAAQAANDKHEFDALMNEHMLTEAFLSRQLFDTSTEGYEFAKSICELTGIDEFWISDQTAHVIATNVDGGLGFLFLDEGQTAPFMQLLNNPQAYVTQPPSLRALDAKCFKYVGIASLDGGIFQIGKESELYGENTAKSFTSVAEYMQESAQKIRQSAEMLLTLLGDH